MFTVVIEQLSELDDGALDARIRELELEQRRNAAEQAAAIAEPSPGASTPSMGIAR